MRLQNDEDQGNGNSSPANSMALRVETRDGLPIRLVYRHRAFRVTSAVPVACVQGRWWLDWPRGGVLRRTFRVGLDNGHGNAFDAELTKQGAVWKLSKILD